MSSGRKPKDGIVLNRGLDDKDMLIDLILQLTPLQAKGLLKELLPRYTRQSGVKYYNIDLEQDKNGKIRLLPSQYQSIRTKFGDTYTRKAFEELTNYIEYLERNPDIPRCKAKLKKLMSGTHNSLIAHPDGWVYNKCKCYIVVDPPRQINLNPFLIDDFHTAKEYILSIPVEVRRTSMDVEALIRKFPELGDIAYNERATQE